MIERARLTMDAVMRPGKRTHIFEKGHAKVGGMTKVYHLARRVLFDHSPEMVAELIDLALNCPDEKVRAGCLIAALDRAGVRPMDFVVWCGSMSAMGEMPMPGSWTMSMAWMRMPGQTWPGSAASFLGMWVVMMVAMILPCLVPMLWRYRQAVGRPTPSLWKMGVAIIPDAIDGIRRRKSGSHRTPRWSRRDSNRRSRLPTSTRTVRWA